MPHGPRGSVSSLASPEFHKNPTEENAESRLQHRSPQGGLQIWSNLFHIPTNPHIQNSLSLGQKVKFPYEAIVSWAAYS